MTVFLLKISSIWGPNVLDWIRSAYFSLLSGLTVTFILKFSVLSQSAKAIFLAGLFGLLFGLIVSVKITSRFKNLEKDYDKDTTLDKGKIKLADYFYKKDVAFINQHLILYTIIFPSLLIIGYAGFIMEAKAAASSSEIKSSLINIQKKDSLLIKMDSLSQLQKKEIINLKDSLMKCNAATDIVVQKDGQQQDSVKLLKHKLQNSFPQKASK
jgi:hypothetical protein